MQEENEAILFAMIIGAVIIGIGLAMFFNRLYTGFGAVVLAIGMMTLSLILTMRAEEIIRLKIIPTGNHSEGIVKVPVETLSRRESAQPSSTEMRAHGALEPKESYEEHVEQDPEILEVEETQQVQETEQPYTPSISEPSPSQEPSFMEPEQEQEPSIETAPPSSKQSQETEEPQESPTTV